MVSGWFEQLELPSEGGGTACMTIGCPTDFVAVRLGFPNVSRRSWKITRAIARASEGFSDYVTPLGDGMWAPFTFLHEGVDSPNIVAPGGGPTEIEVRPLYDTPLTAAAGVSWTWTDWTPIRSLAADPATGMRVLMLRALIPSRQTVTCANGQLRSFTGNRDLNRGHDVLIGGLKFDLDHVIGPDVDKALTTQTWIDNQLAPGTLFPMVQFLTQRPGIAGIATGDSHTQGTATTEQFFSFSLCATGSLNDAYRNDLPFSMCNCGMGGLTSSEFFARFETLIRAIQPSYAVLPGWTYNDANGSDRADQTAMNLFLARLIGTIETCEASGILPIVLTPFPRNADTMTDVQLGPWQWLRSEILRMGQQGLTVIDATSILANRRAGTFDGTYLPEMSDDEAHPNDAGHLKVGLALADAVRLFL